MVHETITGSDPEILRAEGFLSGVYDKTRAWLKEKKGAQVVNTFDDVKVSEWERVSTYPPGEITLGIDVKSATLLRDGLNTYGIVLGKRSRSKHDRVESPSLLFGFLPNQKWVVEGYTEETPIEKLRTLVNGNSLQTRTAEFYFRSNSRMIDVDCWIDSPQYGGAGLSRWERKDNVMSLKGEKAIMDTLKRLVRNYDPIAE